MQVPPFVSGADDEHTHVLTTCCCDCRFVVLTNEIPVQIHIIEHTRFNCSDDQRRLPMGGEAHMADPALGLPATHHIQTPSRTDGLVEMGMEIDAVNRQQIHPIHAQTRE